MQKKSMAEPKPGPGRVRGAVFSKRLVIATVAALGFIWILSSSHSIRPVQERYKALYNSDILDRINNSTLGVRFRSIRLVHGDWGSDVANRRSLRKST